jgi:predicted nucleic acid-binding protein
VILVLDASALIALARIGQLDLLRQLAGTVHIPEAVYDEVVRRGAGRPGSADVAHVSWIIRHDVRDRARVDHLRGQVGRGEAEAIVLAWELGADAIILDDATARGIAEAAGQRVRGLLGLLLYCKERGVVRALKPILDELLAAGFFLDDALYHVILRQAGEAPSP